MTHLFFAGKNWLHFLTICEETVAPIAMELDKCPWNSTRNGKNGSDKRIFPGRFGLFDVS